MYMASIFGWNGVHAFSKDKETAKRLALKEKELSCKDDLDEWSWERCEEYYGASVVFLEEGTVIAD